MAKTEKLYITNNDIKLEAEYYQSNSNISPAVIITHPHPQMGGNMLNNVVSGLFNEFSNNNISCLRFNFRAVGRSTGTHTSGRGELSDTKACIDFLLNEKKIETIFICGYSYGAAIGCSAVNHSEKILAFVAISFPWDYMGSKYKKLSQTDKPKLFIQGNGDNVAYFSKFQEHYNDYNEPKECKIIKGADHFWRGYEKQLSSETLNFFNQLIN